MKEYRTSAYIDPFARVAWDAKVWHFSVVLSGASIGSGTVVGSRVEIGRGCQIGSGSRIGSGTFLPSNSIVGDRVFIGPNVTFTDDRHPAAGNIAYNAEPPVVEDGASIGAGAVILPGVRIGAGAMVGAGAVVTRDVPANALVRGEPARNRAA